MQEEWKVLEENKNIEISSFGNVRRNGQKVTPYADPEGYLRCSIGGKTERVHRLVAKYFIPNPNNYNMVDHIDQDKTNNKVNNLRWTTPSENGKNAVYSKPRYEPIIGINVTTNEIKEFQTQAEAGRYIGVNDPIHGGEVNKVLHGKRKTTHGWTFFFKSEYKEGQYEN